MNHDVVQAIQLTVHETPPINEEVWITKYALDKTIGVYKVSGFTLVDSGNDRVMFCPAHDRTSFVKGEWHRTGKEALAAVKSMARKAMKRLMAEHNHAKNIMLDVNDGRLPASRKP